MGRVANELTAIQQDDKLFAELAGKIKRARALTLDKKYGLISHETITKYLRREPVQERSEDLIRESVRRWEADKAERDQRRLDEMRSGQEPADIHTNQLV